MKTSGRVALIVAFLSPLMTLAGDHVQAEATTEKVCETLVAHAVGCVQASSPDEASEQAARCEAYLGTASEACVTAEQRLFACIQDNVSCADITQNCSMLSGRAVLACPDFMAAVWQGDGE